MSDATASPPPFDAAADLLACGQRLEARGDLHGAVAFYDQAIAAVGSLPASSVEVRRLHGVAWMNRGNALQKSTDVVALELAVAAYDAAIALLRTLPVETTPAFRNHLGTAWLNRGHALLLASDANGATASFKQAIAQLEQLPRVALEENAHYRLNLAGAHANFAHSLLGSSPALACAAARSALALLAPVERTGAAFAEMSLRARRALVTALGERLVGTNDIAVLAAEASDVIDDGLALARRGEQQGALLRPLALRLFRLGAQFYRVHQPHFLAEFVHENLAADAFGSDADFRTVAAEALNLALADLQRPQLLVAGSPDAEKLLATARALRAAQQELSNPPA